jgi:hypothetical protein
MCKILTLIGIKNSDPKQLKAFLKSAAVHLTSRGDDDGFGYAGVSEFGLFGERWLDIEDAFKSRPSAEQDAKVMLELGNTVVPVDSYNSFGTVSIENANTMLLHARAATNSVSMSNTHPFVEGNTALIHNGIITAPTVKNESSTCDSELILRLFLKYGVTQEASMLEHALNEMNGYWACGVISLNDNRWIVDVFKDSRAELSYAEIEELGNARVYCTSAELLLSIAKSVKFKTPRIFKVKSDTHVRFDAVTGNILLTQELESTCSIYSWHDYSEHGKKLSKPPMKNYPYTSNYPIGTDETPDLEDDEYQASVIDTIERNLNEFDRKEALMHRRNRKR